MATQFEHNGVNFRAEKIDAMRQFHVVRRLAPVLAEMAGAVGNKASTGDSAAAVAGFTGVANALAKLSDADADYVLHTLLSHVTREQPGAGWHKVSNGSNLMFADLGLPALMYLAYKALQENLGDFFAAIPSNLKAAALKQTAP